MLRIIIILCVVSTTFGQTKYQKDFDIYWKTIDTYFGYFDTQETNWNKVKEYYGPKVREIQNDDDFIALLERTNLELYNGHVGLNVNRASSYKLVPSSSDISIRYKDNKYIINGLREGSPSEKAGLKLGMVITGVNDISIHKTVQQYLPVSTNEFTPQMHEYLANMILAGTHDTKRSINVNDSLTFYPDDTKWNSSKDLITTKRLENNIGYIKINNSLGNNHTIKAFDKALDQLNTSKGIILDLRETPSGGDSNIARGIMGRFIDKELPYQIHTFPYEEKMYDTTRKTIELVVPRGKTYTGTLIVLCGPWTGSMGEGITIGFDAMERAEIVGAKMAGLLGAIYDNTLPETRIGFQIPVEKLFHVNGMPREKFVPKYYEQDTQGQLEKAIELINSL
ncbi:S41 family peptidase [Aquimarina sp. 2201CG5-10]|uniref:S41 family peptidase n=1 Tax=Aquimarina callyspongiae TaxID=3098150 RepID=UPI002AB504A9|nr:S41 family peptidase [Aquimarina sp. 2201CG5-10]MDY8136392.1 S41 family peptidase [Aquimarina sp. 2201CG5-10]